MIQSDIAQALARFGHASLREAATGLANALGYVSDRTAETGSVAQFCEIFDAPGALNAPKACKPAWQDVQLVFQLTDDELAPHVPLFKEKRVAKTLMQSYVFVAIELKPSDYSRSTLAGIARLVNRVLPMPVLVMFKIGGKLTLAVINRRTSKRDTSRDVLGKVTLVQEIDTAAPHRGHLDILASFSLSVLKEGRRRITNFEDLHAAWEEVFNVELLNKRFYEELANWYFWARGQVWFPNDANPHQDEAAHHSTSVIRLLTRLIFCWFLKEKGLVPARLFDQTAIATVLAKFDGHESSYYRAILQNLFFATLNQPMEPTKGGARAFAHDGEFHENKQHHGVKTLYRYGALFREPGNALGLFAAIPFLNGGLFACLDTEDDNGKVRYVDGFSRNVKKQPTVIH